MDGGDAVGVEAADGGGVAAGAVAAGLGVAVADERIVDADAAVAVGDGMAGRVAGADDEDEGVGVAVAGGVAVMLVGAGVALEQARIAIRVRAATRDAGRNPDRREYRARTGWEITLAFLLSCRGTNLVFRKRTLLVPFSIAWRTVRCDVIVGP